MGWLSLDVVVLLSKLLQVTIKAQKLLLVLRNRLRRASYQSQPDTSYQQSVAASVTPSTSTLIGTGLPLPEGLHVYCGPVLLGPVAGTLCITQTRTFDSPSGFKVAASVLARVSVAVRAALAVALADRAHGRCGLDARAHGGGWGCGALVLADQGHCCIDGM